MYKLIHLILIISLLLSCRDSKPRRPVNIKKKTFLSESAKRNKNKLEIEQEIFKKIIKKESLLNYKFTPKGFWYAYLEKGSNSSIKTTKGDYVTFKYRIEDINKNLIYSEDELGIISFRVDEEDLIPALREGVKLLSTGDIGVFLFPSYLCFGYQGDGEKIGINQPLRFTIEVIKIEK